MKSESAKICIGRPNSEKIVIGLESCNRCISNRNVLKCGSDLTRGQQEGLDRSLVTLNENKNVRGRF